MLISTPGAPVVGSMRSMTGRFWAVAEPVNAVVIKQATANRPRKQGRSNMVDFFIRGLGALGASLGRGSGVSLAFTGVTVNRRSTTCGEDGPLGGGIHSARRVAASASLLAMDRWHTPRR